MNSYKIKENKGNKRINRRRETFSFTRKRTPSTVLCRKCWRRGIREGWVCDARTTRQSSRQARVQARVHSAAAIRFCPARASSAGSGDRSSRRACYLGNFIARLKILRVRLIFVVMMSIKRQQILQLTGMTSKKQRETKNRVVGCKPESDRFCLKWQIFAETDTIRVFNQSKRQQDLVNLIHLVLSLYHLHFAFMETSEDKRIRE